MRMPGEFVRASPTFKARFMAMTGILGAVITFFGLLQAWKQNRATGMEVTGPHALATEPEPEPAVTKARPPLPQGAPALPQSA